MRIFPDVTLIAGHCCLTSYRGLWVSVALEDARTEDL
jgi:hypothetical protein